MSSVIITGASRGIGRSIAEEFAMNGYDLFLICRNSIESLCKTADELRQKYNIRVNCHKCDVSNPDDIDSLPAELFNADILINNAGISYVGLLQDMSVKEWQDTVNTNLSSCFYMSRKVLPAMIQKQSGRIVNISSVWGNVGASMEVAYSASKGGVNSFTKALAKETAPSGICVNAVAFGYIDTEMNSHLSTEEKNALFEEIPAGRPGSCSEAAKFVFSVCTSPSYLTGQVITFDGAWV